MITDQEAVKYGGAFYHKDCFVCGSCKKHLTGSFQRKEDGTKLCQDCIPKKICEPAKEYPVPPPMPDGSGFDPRVHNTPQVGLKNSSMQSVALPYVSAPHMVCMRKGKQVARPRHCELHS